MSRPNQTWEKRKQFLPVIAQAFVRGGFRRTTTAELARQCRIRQNVLYRLWLDKKAMFIASLGYVYDLSAQTWRERLKKSNPRLTAAQSLLQYEASHQGEFGLNRVVFGGLNETDDPEIRAALTRMYSHFQQFIADQIRAHHQTTQRPGDNSADLAAWALIGLGTVNNIGRELGLISAATRRRLMQDYGQVLLNGIP